MNCFPAGCLGSVASLCVVLLAPSSDTHPPHPPCHHPPPQIVDDDTWLVVEAGDAEDSDADSQDSNAEGFHAHDYPGAWVGEWVCSWPREGWVWDG